MNWIKIIFLSSFVFLLVLCSYVFLDERAALAINRLWMSHPGLSILSSEIPDLLLFFVCLITGGAWAAYYSLVRRGIHNIHVWFFHHVATIVPISFLVKSVLKFMVGRIETRFWLQYPYHERFHWFHGGRHYSGFPSGHMTVFVVLVIALWKYYPRYRLTYIGLVSTLALALTVTAYHFISDIIAGAYVGFLVYYFTDRALVPYEKRGQGSGGQDSAEQPDRIVRGV
jgi:membrane-associated phospholipid phosphatase